MSCFTINDSYNVTRYTISKDVVLIINEKEYNVHELIEKIEKMEKRLTQLEEDVKYRPGFGYEYLEGKERIETNNYDPNYSHNK
jgi:hypothetical protein